MPPSESNKKYETITSGFRHELSYKQEVFDSWTSGWLEAKSRDDGVWPYWRIHNNLYDLTDFIARHPGGKLWIEETKGLDITESFEVSHISDEAQKILPKFLVRETATPRSSPFTFKEDGFYKSLKRKASPILKRHGMDELWKFRVIQDSVFVSFLSLFFYSALNNSWIGIALTGLLLMLSVNIAHNYAHLRDNWRMYIRVS